MSCIVCSSFFDFTVTPYWMAFECRSFRNGKIIICTKVDFAFSTWKYKMKMELDYKCPFRLMANRKYVVVHLIAIMFLMGWLTSVGKNKRAACFIEIDVRTVYICAKFIFCLSSDIRHKKLMIYSYKWSNYPNEQPVLIAINVRFGAWWFLNKTLWYAGSSLKIFHSFFIFFWLYNFPVIRQKSLESEFPRRTITATNH